MVKNRNCVNCKSINLKFVFAANKTKYLICRDCKLVFSFRIPTEKYEEYSLSHHLKWENYLKNVSRKTIKTLNKFREKGNVLEIGSGLGFMLEELEESGYQAQGIEPSVELVKFSKSKGLDVQKGYFSSKRFEGRKFDVVLMSHVLEHIRVPGQFLKEVGKTLKKDGILLIQVPNFASLRSDIEKENWRYLVPDDHFIQFTPQTLTNVLERNGFEVLYLRSTGTFSELDSIIQEIIRSLTNDFKRFIYYALELIPSYIQFLLGKEEAILVIARLR